MNEKRRNKLAAMLIELDFQEIRRDIDRYMDKKDVEKATKAIQVQNAIDVILNYFEEKDLFIPENPYLQK